MNIGCAPSSVDYSNVRRTPNPAHYRNVKRTPNPAHYRNVGRGPTQEVNQQLHPRPEESSEARHCQAVDVEVADGVETEEGFGYPGEMIVHEPALVLHAGCCKVVD